MTGRTARPIDATGPWDGKRAGIGMVPEDRKASGLFLTMDIVNNLSATVMDRVSSGLRLLQPEGRGACEDLCRRAAHRHAQRAPDRRQPFRRQPAESAAGQMAGDGAETPHRRRTDARRRCRRALRNLPAAARAGRPRRGAAGRFVGSAGGAGAGRPHRRDGRGTHSRRTAGRQAQRRNRCCASPPATPRPWRNCARANWWRELDDGADDAGRLRARSRCRPSAARTHAARPGRLRAS